MKNETFFPFTFFPRRFSNKYTHENIRNLAIKICKQTKKKNYFSIILCSDSSNEIFSPVSPFSFFLSLHASSTVDWLRIMVRRRERAPRPRVIPGVKWLACSFESRHPLDGRKPEGEDNSCEMARSTRWPFRVVDKSDVD